VPATGSVRVICAAALASCCLAAVGLALPVPAVLRAVAVLTFCCWVPGTALFATLGAWQLIRSPAASIAASLSVVILLSQAGLAVHRWAPALGTGILAVVCGVALGLALVSGRSERARSEERPA
jgi:hypothetical protein